MRVLEQDGQLTIRAPFRSPRHRRLEIERDEMVENPFEPALMAAIETWRPLIDGNPRIARGVYEWKRQA